METITLEVSTGKKKRKLLLIFIFSGKPHTLITSSLQQDYIIYMIKVLGYKLNFFFEWHSVMHGNRVSDQYRHCAYSDVPVGMEGVHYQKWE